MPENETNHRTASPAAGWTDAEARRLPELERLISTSVDVSPGQWIEFFELRVRQARHQHGSIRAAKNTSEQRWENVYEGLPVDDSVRQSALAELDRLESEEFVAEQALNFNKALLAASKRYNEQQLSQRVWRIFSQRAAEATTAIDNLLAEYRRTPFEGAEEKAEPRLRAALALNQVRRVTGIPFRKKIDGFVTRTLFERYEPVIRLLREHAPDDLGAAHSLWTEARSGANSAVYEQRRINDEYVAGMAMDEATLAARGLDRNAEARRLVEAYELQEAERVRAKRRALEAERRFRRIELRLNALDSIDPELKAFLGPPNLVDQRIEQLSAEILKCYEELAHLELMRQPHQTPQRRQLEDHQMRKAQEAQLKQALRQRTPGGPFSEQLFEQPQSGKELPSSDQARADPADLAPAVTKAEERPNVPEPAAKVRPPATVSQRFGTGIAVGSYGLGLTTAGVAAYKGDYSAAAASLGVTAISAVPDVAQAGARALAAAGRAGAANRLTLFARFAGPTIAGGFAIAASHFSGEAIQRAKQAEAEAKRLEQASPHSKKLETARDQAEEAKIDKAFARFNERLGLAALITSPWFRASVGVGVVALGINGFDMGAQYFGGKESRAWLARKIDQFINDPSSFDVLHRYVRDHLSPAAAHWVDSLDGRSSPPQPEPGNLVKISRAMTSILPAKPETEPNESPLTVSHKPDSTVGERRLPPARQVANQLHAEGTGGAAKVAV